MKNSNDKTELSTNTFKRIAQFSFNNSLLLFNFFLTNKFKKKLHPHAIKLMNYTGYSYPIDLMRFHIIEYNSTQIQVPVDSEKHLELTYGVDWKIPKKDYIWYEEANNLTK